MLMFCSYAIKSKRKGKLRLLNQDQRLASDLVHLLRKAELLDGEIFYTLDEARIIIESWRRSYNSLRPRG